MKKKLDKGPGGGGVGLYAWNWLICIFQAVCQFFCEYLIILAQRGKK